MAILKYGSKEVGTSKVDLLYGSRVWRAFVDTVEPIENAIGTSVVLSVNDVPFVGTIIGGDDNIGRGSYIVAGGKGAWRLRVGPVSLRSDSGVRLSTAANHLLDAMTAVSPNAVETLVINDGTRVLGNAWFPLEDSASSLLDTICSSWHVNRGGETVLNGSSSVVIDSARYAVHRSPIQKTFMLSPRTPLDVSDLFDAVGGTIAGDPFTTPQRIRTIRLTESTVLRLHVQS